MAVFDPNLFKTPCPDALGVNCRLFKVSCAMVHAIIWPVKCPHYAPGQPDEALPDGGGS